MKKAGVSSILFVVILLAVAVIAEAQQPKKVPRIGYLSQLRLLLIPPGPRHSCQGLREFGYIEGQNIVIEYRYADGKLDRCRSLWRSWCVSKSMLSFYQELPRQGSQESHQDDSHRHGVC